MKKINNITKTLSIAILLLIGVASKAQTSIADRSTRSENRVAILPMTYMNDGNQFRSDEMRYRLQNIAYLYLKGESMELRFQDPAQTNAILIRKGVNENNFRQFTPAELAEMLHVQYVLIGTVSQESIGTSTHDHSRRVDREYRRGRYERETSWHGHTREQFNTYIDLSVYNNEGDQIFSRSRRSILSTPDAYRNGLEYLLKRTPLYKR